jgi:16S rRNA (guanine527-N7)-methyltransferase
MTGGVLVVSEPPGSQGERWPAAGLAELGLVRVETVDADARFQVLRQAEVCPDRFPRRVGVPARRPLF